LGSKSAESDGVEVRRAVNRFHKDENVSRKKVTENKMRQLSMPSGWYSNGRDFTAKRLKAIALESKNRVK
jgi:hypothetical protein